MVVRSWLACVLAAAMLSSTITGTAVAGGRILNASDTIQVKVVGQPDFDMQIRIGNDGSISYPYLGRIQAVDLTEDQLAEIIKNGLAKKGIIRKPVVLVTTVEGGVYFLYGYVNKPGQYPLMRKLTLQQALAAGGGISPLGSEWMIKIKRHNASGVEEISPTMDTEIEANDTIVVRERLF
jgi:polysaccharide export outer membrane protein